MGAQSASYPWKKRIVLSEISGACVTNNSSQVTQPLPNSTRHMNIAKPLFGAVTLASLALTACNGAPGEVDEQTGETQEAALTSNALTVNALTVNALTVNALTVNALTVNALTSNALTSNSLVSTALTDPNGRELFSYIVSCALPAQSEVTVKAGGVSYSFDGGLGLAPQWGQPGGKCDEGCQEWVSACLLARVDYLGVHREISVRGQNPALAISLAELFTFPQREATYFGNVFTAPAPQRRYACLSPGQTEISRVCGPTLKGCVVDVDAACNRVCGFPTLDGSFPDCQPEDGDRDDPVYHGSITVFLPL
jgi:hypothetical protein